MCFGMLLYFGGKYNGQNASDLSRLALRRFIEWLPPDLPLVRNLFGAGSQPKLCYMPDADEKPVKEDHEIWETATNLLPSIMLYGFLILCVCFGLRYIQRVLPRIPFVGSLFGAESQQKLLFVPDADNEPKVGHAISEPALFRFLLDEENPKRQINEAEAGIPKMLDVLKDVDKNWEIKEFETHQSSMGSATDSSMAFHVFIVFKTTSETDGVYWWSLEKGLDYITLQRSRNKENVKDKLNGKQRNKVKSIKEDLKGKGTIKDLFAILWAHQMIPEKYNIYNSNCQFLVTFIGQQITEIGYKYKGNFPYSPPRESGRDKKLLDLINVIRGCSDWPPLFHLIKMGSTDLFDKIVASGMYDINASCNGFTLLHLATWLQKTEMVEHLLQPPLNADPTKRDASGKSALLLAASKYESKAKKGLIDLLLAHDKVNVDDVDGKGQTALHLAAYRFNVVAVRKLLVKGANPNITDKWGQSPLHVAAKKIDGYEIMDLVLAHSKVKVDDVDRKGQTALHIAARKSNVGAVQKLLKKGANPYIYDEWGQSPLHWAAKRESYGNEIMDLLLAHSKVKVDYVDGKGRTALHAAVSASNVMAVEHLIDKGANPNAVDKSGDSPLYVAALQRDGIPLIDLLLEAQKVKGMGDVNDRNKKGRTALHYAAAYSNEITAEHLIKKGANVNCRTNVGLTPLHYAVLGADDMKIIDLLLQNINEMDIQQYRNDERLFFFARHNVHGLGDKILNRLVKKEIQPPCTETDHCTGESGDEVTDVNTRRFVLDKGADPSIDLTGFDCLDFLLVRVKISLGIYDDINDRNQDGETLLLVAIRANNVNAVRLLLEKGADPTIRNNKGETPFYVAVRKHTACGILHLLLESGKVDINETTTEQGRTALYMTVKKSNTAAAEFLLSKGAKPNVADENGATPLHLAAANAKDMDIVELLLNHPDVDVNLMDDYWQNAQDYAMENENGLDERIANLLKEKGVIERENELFREKNESLEKLLNYTSSNAEEEIESILSDRSVPFEDKIARINEENLISAIKNSDVESVRLLLENGADISACGEYGMNALHLASKYARTTHLIDVILETGKFDINAADNYGRTPLHYAIMGTNSDINARHLIRKGADPTIANREGNTPFHLAAFRGKEIETIKLILENERVDINSRDFSGMTALHYAIWASNVITVRYLLKKGADPNAVKKNGATLFHLVVQSDDYYKTTELIDIILETGKFNINAADNDGRTPLHYAIASFDSVTIIIRRLIQLGADPGIAAKNGVTPLHMAARNVNSMDLIDELLPKVKTGAVDVNCVDKNGRTPLAYARDNHHSRLGQRIITRLKEYGAKE